MSLTGALRFYNPNVKTIQGANSKTFKNPGLDTTLTIPELFEFHAKNSPEHPVFVYTDDDLQQHTIRFPEVYRAIRKAATIASSHYDRQADYYAKAQVGKSPNEPPVVGILATAGTSASPPTPGSFPLLLNPVANYMTVLRRARTQPVSTRPRLGTCSRLDLILHAQGWTHVPRSHALPDLDTKQRDRSCAPRGEDGRTPDVRQRGPRDAAPRPRGQRDAREGRRCVRAAAHASL